MQVLKGQPRNLASEESESSRKQCQSWVHARGAGRHWRLQCGRCAVVVAVSFILTIRHHATSACAPTIPLCRATKDSNPLPSFHLNPLLLLLLWSSSKRNLPHRSHFTYLCSLNCSSLTPVTISPKRVLHVSHPNITLYPLRNLTRKKFLAPPFHHHLLPLSTTQEDNPGVINWVVYDWSA